MEKSGVSISEGKSRFLVRLVKYGLGRKKSSTSTMIATYSYDEAKEIIKLKYPNHKIIEIIKY